MDGKDYKIIAALQQGARTPLRKISKLVHMSESAVRKRVKRLEREGVIERYTVVVNPMKLGYNALAIIGVDTTPEKHHEILEKLMKIEDVKQLMISAGEHMIMGMVQARDNKELTDIVLRKIGGIEGVTKVRTSVILERVKEMC
ncbi:MAG: Lrp/AsnC family transcriptional regulator [Hadesarchaea archaeon]|nr:Lrp/AsnC family transcriptional regulator [Hadesarchaea archaeon]MDH5685690.1 Lrp/AsnC family transcriptional regulator [Hadesarchaea archaeon]